MHKDLRRGKMTERAFFCAETLFDTKRRRAALHCWVPQCKQLKSKTSPLDNTFARDGSHSCIHVFMCLSGTWRLTLPFSPHNGEWSTSVVEKEIITDSMKPQQTLIWLFIFFVHFFPRGRERTEARSVRKCRLQGPKCILFSSLTQKVLQLTTGLIRTVSICF